jgi:hypothetical protein
VRPRRTIGPGYRFGRLTVERLAGDDRYELRCSCGTTCERDYRSLAYAKHVPMCDACRGEKAQAATRKATRLGVGALTAADARVALADGPLTTAALEAATRSTIGGRIHRERLTREGVVCHTERNELVWSIVEVRTPAMVIAESGAPSLAPYGPLPITPVTTGQSGVAGLYTVQAAATGYTTQSFSNIATGTTRNFDLIP